MVRKRRKDVDEDKEKLKRTLEHILRKAKRGKVETLKERWKLRDSANKCSEKLEKLEKKQNKNNNTFGSDGHLKRLLCQKKAEQITSELSAAEKQGSLQVGSVKIQEKQEKQFKI
jgi:hypothetical protein